MLGHFGMLIGLELISACAPTVAIPGGKCGQESSPQCQYQTGAGIGQAGMGHAGIGQGGEQVTVTTAAGDTRPEQRKTLLWCSMERRAGQPIGATVDPLLGKSPNEVETSGAQGGHAAEKAKANDVFREIALSEGEARESAANLPRQGARVNIPSLAQARGIISSHPEGRGIVPAHPEAAGIIPVPPPGPGDYPAPPRGCGDHPVHTPRLRESFPSHLQAPGIVQPHPEAAGIIPPHLQAPGIIQAHPEAVGIIPQHPQAAGIVPLHLQAPGIIQPHPEAAGIIPAHPEAAGIIPPHPEAVGIIPAHPEARPIIPPPPGFTEIIPSRPPSHGDHLVRPPRPGKRD